MTYILSISAPVRYEADNDDHARVIAEHIEDTVLAVELPHGAAFQDDAPGYTLLESRPAGLRVVVDSEDDIARYAPFPANTGAGHPPCPECLDYIAASHTPAGPVELVVETLEDDDPELDQPAHEVRHP